MTNPTDAEVVNEKIKSDKVTVKEKGQRKGKRETKLTSEAKPRQKSPEDEVFYKALVDAYAKKKEPVTSGDIAAITVTKRSPVRRAMARLIEQGRVEGIMTEMKNIKFLYKPKA